MGTLPIYLDYMATTPADPRVVAAMTQYMGPDGIFGNPASTSHIYGRMAAQAVEKSRQIIAELINAHDDEIIFTSGATESNNLAILGAARFYQGKGRHVITLETEHKAVLDSFCQLEKEGYRVTYLPVDNQGMMSLAALEAALDDDTILVSVMHVNNEIGVIQDIAALGALLRQRGVLFHVDAAQSAGKLPIDVRKIGVDLMSFSGHKMYGPKGIGALYVRGKPRIRLAPLSFGGGHEHGLRSGTLATSQIVGLAQAFKIAVEEQSEEQARLKQYRERIWDSVKAIAGVRLNGHPTERVAGNLNICFKDIDSDTLILSLRDIAVSSTSACSSASQQPSYVLRAIGLSAEEAFSSIRLSLGRFTTATQVAEICQLIAAKITNLRDISP